MLRTFKEHAVRQEVSLNDWWDFVTASERVDRGKLPKVFTRSIHVPNAWENTPGLEKYRGQGWFRKSFQWDEEDDTLRLVFGGVSHTADVYIDGKHVGHHYDAFTPFEVVVPNLKPGEHELIVAVDNTFGEHSALHTPNDYYTYGGITRPAMLEKVNSTYIEKIFATPRKTGKTWALDVKVRVKNVSKQDSKYTLTLASTDLPALSEKTLTFKAGATKEVKFTWEKLEAEAWTPDMPVLYDLFAVLVDGEADPVDDLYDRVGFREVTVKGKKILLNGQSFKMRGYNRHEDHPDYGCAIPVEMMLKDLNIMRDLNCNAIRTCHYPNDMRFLDLCDEMGFFVWEESHTRTVCFENPNFHQQVKDSTVEMIEWHFNHPCIVLWGCLNECDTHTKLGIKTHKDLLQLIKKMDPSRPATYAANRYMMDECHGYADVVSWNRYTGWYGDGPEDIEPALKELLKWVHSEKSKGGKGKPFIMSEFGAGAIYQYRGNNEVHWTEDYMETVMDECLRVYLNHPDMCGAFIWQYCDVRVTHEAAPIHNVGHGWWCHRPRTMNNKGTVNEYRQPKLCYKTVKKRMAEAIEKWDK